MNNILPVIKTEMLKSKLEGSDTFLLYVGRPTCIQCQEIEPTEPTLRNILKSVEIKASYYRTDIARNEDEKSLEEVAEKLDLTVVPSLLIISKGVLVDRLDGVYTEKAISEFLENNKTIFEEDA
ncbi:thioredoxin family protein [Enterococcus faecium]|uniref:Thioredoxin n=1 Tax=Enterococcus faecium TaxID=1352 RepID=A0AB74CWA5_ENTFC|nr:MULTISPECIES: thioredoxin family protein [Enterococcus]EGP4987212.1 thioredoxin family protein [Enterococcus faecium]EGP5255505.1 thioredoxin [Enterococcus faecium]EME7079725.1 thioredoxin family protein [Enterococcus faecium]EME7142983.1 thioredoxin family protein [Enterococcus faecium]EMF0335031.1 thioredoxin family protein [Enterococcus faecium]